MEALRSVRTQLRLAAVALAPHSREQRRDAALLLSTLLGKDRTWLLSHPETALTQAQIEAYKTLVARRSMHEPMQYILGEQEFYGLRFEVTPAVLIPRPETEHLVEAALELLPEGRPLHIVDIGTGSGAIAVTLAHHRPQAQVLALDLSPSALHIAEKNARAHGVVNRVVLVESDLLHSLPGERFDMIVSNPPYIAENEELEPQVRDHEPRSALFSGSTGLEIYERLIPEAWNALLPGGWLLLEIGYGQADALRTMLDGWHSVRFVCDLQGIERVAIARFPAAKS